MAQFRIENIQVEGLERSMVASGNPMRTVIRREDDYVIKDLERSAKLGSTKAGGGHDNFLKGITVYMDIYAPLFMWKQLQRYHWFEIVSSQSTMHSLVKFDPAAQFVDDVDPIIAARYEELLEDYRKDYPKNPDPKKWRALVASLPSGFILGATVVTNYLQLKTMVAQRAHHRLSEWAEFIKICNEELPFFETLTKQK